MNANRFALILILSLFTILSLTRIANIESRDFNVQGLNDASAYWSAHHLLSVKQNPYSEMSMLNTQRTLGYLGHSPIMLWNPPWVLVILSPLLSLSFTHCVVVLYILNLFLWILICYFSWKIFSDTPIAWDLCAVNLAMLSFWLNISLGQFTMIVAAATAGTFWAIRNKKDWLAGAFLVLTTIKPHLIYLLYPVLWIWIIREKRWKVGLSWAGIFLTVAAICEWLHPGVFINWLQMKSKPYEYLPLSLVTLVRLVIFQVSRIDMVHFLSILIPAAALGITLRKYLFSTIRWEQTLPFLICLSLFTSPYGWPNDQALLLIVLTGILACGDQKENKQRPWKVRIVVGLHVLTILCLFFFRGAHYLTWLPLATLILWNHFGKNISKEAHLY